MWFIISGIIVVMAAAMLNKGTKSNKGIYGDDDHPVT